MFESILNLRLNKFTLLLFSFHAKVIIIIYTICLNIFDCCIPHGHIDNDECWFPTQR